MTVPLHPDPADPVTRKSRAVAGMFGAIAPTYDLLNHLLSLNVDRRWRKAAARALAPAAGAFYLDLCAGTGDLALAILSREPAAYLVGADFCRPMLERAPAKARQAGSALHLAEADALNLPFKSGGFDGLAVAFGVRNFEDLDRGFNEMARVIKPGGRAVILEFSQPKSALFGALYRFYFNRLLPWVGRLISRDNHAYGYLPATVARFPGPKELTQKLQEAGFERVSHAPLTFGIAMLTVAEKGRIPIANPPVVE